MIGLIPYAPSLKDEWNTLVNESKNATFLFDRNFMDYHKARFHDASLIFHDRKGHTIALLPANTDEQAQTVYSHQGLTYGGLLMSKNIHTGEVTEALESACRHFAAEGFTTLYYKPIPYIYNRYPSQEDLYFLYRHDARLCTRNLSQTIFIPDAIKMDQLRRRCAAKSVKAGHTISEERDVSEFWYILDKNLRERHGVNPVHSIEELELLMGRFGERIKLYVVKNQSDEVIAGTVVFDTGQTVHTQYISANAEGKATGAFDHLTAHLITDVYADRQYLDFGISTEDGGRVLNEGLTFQKESFGGRGVCYDTWELNLSTFL